MKPINDAAFLQSEKQGEFIDSCEIRPMDELKTWRSVYLNEHLLGLVRVRLGGWSECCRTREDIPKRIYCGDATTLNRKDSIYSLAILGLQKIS